MGARPRRCGSGQHGMVRRVLAMLSVVPCGCLGPRQRCRIYLSAPAVSPEMMRRWAKITSSATGRVTSTTAASIRL
jgi:hypothetical protein